MSHNYELPDDDMLQDDEPQFQRLRKQTGKPLNQKDARKQESKEWGRKHNKYHKERRRYEGNQKP